MARTRKVFTAGDVHAVVASIESARIQTEQLTKVIDFAQSQNMDVSTLGPILEIAKKVGNGKRSKFVGMIHHLLATADNKRLLEVVKFLGADDLADAWNNRPTTETEEEEEEEK